MNMFKRIFSRILSVVLAAAFMLSAFPSGIVSADEAQTTEIENQYIKVIVNNENGGYVISTIDGDILKKSDDNALLTHRGEYFDTSFTSFQAGDNEYVFGERYGLFGTDSTAVTTERDVNGNYIKSTWSAGDIEVEQNISLVNSEASEQLGTVMISYTVRNNASAAIDVKSRVLIDTQLGGKDYGYYEVPKQYLGQGYEYFEFEQTWDASLDPTIQMPADYFVRDNPYAASIVGYGVNSVFTEQKPYKMTFAHWSNIAATVFDYEPDPTLNFTNGLNDKKTADSASALYYDLGTIAAGSEKSFSTYYGVTANLKNKDNQIIINTTAPSKLEFTDDTRTAYQGSDGEENVVRINVTLTNPQYAGKDYKNLAVVAYALGFDTQRQTDAGNWVEYNNTDPVYTDMTDFQSGENRVTYFDFKFTPKERAQLGTFVIKVFDMDESVNDLGYYAEEYCLGTTENHIILPGRDASLPAVTLTGLAPEIIYNQDIRYITVTGNGMSFFRSDLLEGIYLYGENGVNYQIPAENLVYEQGDDPTSVSIMLEDYMEPGRYQLHFLWKSGTGEPALEGVPADFTSDNMVVQVSSDIRYYNACYGVVTVQRNGTDKYKVVPYKDEAAFENANIPSDELLFAFRGDILQDNENKNHYRLFGRDKDININHILNYRGDDLTIEEKADGSVEVLMDGKITTVGANTTVRNGTAAFRLNSGTEYIIPEYSERGEVVANGTLTGNKDFIELKWDNAFDTLTTIGGFLIDMKYGVLGRIQNSDGTTSDIISFGGALDLSFMTPGGAAAARRNKSASTQWATQGTELTYDGEEDGYSFGLAFDEDSGSFVTQTAETDIEPTKYKESSVALEAGVAIHDVLFGGSDPGYIGINMEAHATLPQLVKFLPNEISGELRINTIGGYEVGVDAKVKAISFEMNMSLVVKSSPSGAPIPDKIYFSIGGFEPGINIDQVGVFWLTGLGGGFDKLYESIYGKDGVPPLTLLAHIEFDITKILTGEADLELSLRSIKISFDDLSLKMLKDAKFIEGGEVGLGWYPNFSLNLSAGVNFMHIMTGRLTITAAAGSDTPDFVQLVLNVAIGLPKWIPIVGGMELASAELGGGSEKVWGSVELLSLIKVGFTYYWGGSIEFTHGNPSGSENFATLSSLDDVGVRRTKLLYNKMLEPAEVGTDPNTGETMFVSVGGNLSYSAGSVAVADFDERVKNAESPGIQLMSNGSGNTEIFTNNERTSHLVTFGDSCDYIISISRADGTALAAEEIKQVMSVRQGGAAYELSYYTAPADGASDDEKRAALMDANVNVNDTAAYIAVPSANTHSSLVIEFSDDKAYDVCAIKAEPISTLTSQSAQVSGNTLTVNWDGTNISDSAKIIIKAADDGDDSGVILNETEIMASAKTATVTIPEQLSSGEYSITVILSDEGILYESFDAGKVTVTNANAPAAATGVTIENCGDDKLRITAASGDEDFDGYLVEVYEDGTLADSGLYFEKGEEIIVGGRYEMPVMDDNGDPTGETVTVGYTPGKSYTAKVRLCNIVTDAEGNEVYHSSAYKTSEAVTLVESTQPQIDIEYSGGAINVKSDVPVSGELYINAGTDDGEWFEFTEKNAEISQTIALADGEHTVEFYAEDAEGDHAIVQEIISIDTTPPVIMLASPVSGGSFDGDAVTITASAEKDAHYTFTVNGAEVTPIESDIFDGQTMKCTLPLGDAKDSARIDIVIRAADDVGNETVKSLTLMNSKYADITSVYVSDTDERPEGGKITLGEGETAKLQVFGVLESGETLDVTDMTGTTLEVAGGTAAALDGANVTAGFAGQTMIRAGFSLGGDEYLYDGVVIEVTDKALIYTALDEALAEAKAITNTGYTDESWNTLQTAIAGGEQIRAAEGVTQSNIDSAATAIANAIAGLKTTGTVSSGSSGAAYYTVSFHTNGGSSVDSQRIRRGQKVVEPEAPVKDGFIFEGWYTDKALTERYDFESGVTKTFTLHAKWMEADPGTSAQEWENPFIDVSEGDWFYENVRYAVTNGLMNGTSATEFSPGMDITRGMLVTVLHRMEGSPETALDYTFADVAADEYYAKAVAWADDNGIVLGYSAEEFAPDDVITREQFAAVMQRYAGFKGQATDEADDLARFADAGQISDWARENVSWAVGAGLIVGRDNGALDPQGSATRAEAAAILQRFIEK